MRGSIYSFMLLMIAVSLMGACTGGTGQQVVDPPTNDNASDNTGSDNTSNENENGVPNENASENENVNENENSSVSNDNNPGGTINCDPACVGGQTCVEGFCTPATEPQVQFGFTHETTNVYTPIFNGDDMPIFTFDQGGSHMFITVRIAGFDLPADQRLHVTYFMFWQVDDSAIAGYEENFQFTARDGGYMEAERRVVFISRFPENLDGTGADFTLIVENPDNPDQTIRVETPVTLVLTP